MNDNNRNTCFSNLGAFVFFLGIVSSLAVVGCDSSSNSVPDTETNEAGDFRSFINNGYYLKSLEEYGSDGSLWRTISYSVDYANNTISAFDATESNVIPDHVYFYDDSGDISKIEYYINQNTDTSVEPYLIFNFSRRSDGRLESIAWQYLVGNESDRTTSYVYDTDNSLEGYTTTYIDTAEQESGVFSHNSDGRIFSINETDIELPGTEILTELIWEGNQLQSETTRYTGAAALPVTTKSYDYDTTGNILVIDHKDSQGNSMRREVFSYEAATEPVFNQVLQRVYYMR